MELLSSNTKKIQETETPKKIPYITGNGNSKKLLIFWEMESFSQGLKKIKEIHPEKYSLYFGKCNFLTLRLRNFLYFLNRKLFLYFLKERPLHFPDWAPKILPRKIYYIFSKKKLPEKGSYIFLKKLIFQKGILRTLS